MNTRRQPKVQGPRFADVLLSCKDAKIGSHKVKSSSCNAGFFGEEKQRVTQLAAELVALREVFSKAPSPGR